MKRKDFIRKKANDLKMALILLKTLPAGEKETSKRVHNMHRMYKLFTASLGIPETAKIDNNELAKIRMKEAGKLMEYSYNQFRFTTYRNKVLDCNLHCDLFVNLSIENAIARAFLLKETRACDVCGNLFDLGFHLPLEREQHEDFIGVYHSNCI